MAMEHKLEASMKEIGFKDPIIFEKTIYAFRLLYAVLPVYPALIFKGGTSILLHQFPPVRFSIDIDILLSPAEIDSMSEKINSLMKNSSHFVRVVEDIRKAGIPKKHFKFYYLSKITKKEEYVLLDTVFGEVPYVSTIHYALHKHVLLKDDQIAPCQVRIPSIEGLIADKLTAISLGRLGINLLTHDMQFVKQVIDIGSLFDLCQDVAAIIQNFNKAVSAENELSKTNYTQDEVLESITEVAFKYSQSRLKKANNQHAEIASLNAGLRKVKNHIVTTTYTPEDLRIAMAKTAYLCSVIKKKQIVPLQKSLVATVVHERTLPDRLSILNSLKKINVKAYYFWLLATDV